MGAITLARRPAAVPYSDKFREFLASQPLEYGTGGGVGTMFPPNALVWDIMSTQGECVGHAWIYDFTSRKFDPGMFLSLAVFSEHQQTGVGQAALTQVEAAAASAGIKVLWTQVNGSEGGPLEVRRWLYRNGYKIARESEGYYNMFTDDQYLERVARPVMFSKELPFLPVSPTAEPIGD